MIVINNAKDSQIFNQQIRGNANRSINYKKHVYIQGVDCNDPHDFKGDKLDKSFFL